MNHSLSQQSSTWETYLIAVKCVLWSSRGNWNSIRLAATIPLTVQVLAISANNSFFFITTLALNFWCVRSYSIQGAPQYCGKRYKLDKITDAQVKNSTLNSFFYRHSFVQWQHCIEFNTTNQSGLWHIRNKSKARKQTAQPHI